MVFLDNKYTAAYFKIIGNAKNRQTVNGYTERHHIIPSSLSGKNTAENIAILTGREHFICHRLLSKMTTGDSKYKMLAAVFRMMHSNQPLRYIGTSHTYEKVKSEKAILHSKLFAGDKNPFYGKNHSDQTRDKLREARYNQVQQQGTTMTEAAREKLSKAAKGRVLSDEHKRKIGLANSGKIRTEECKKKLALTRVNRPLTPEQKKFLSDIAKNISKPKIQCPHCHKLGGLPSMKRWHFENCKVLYKGN